MKSRRLGWAWILVPAALSPPAAAVPRTAWRSLHTQSSVPGDTIPLCSPVRRNPAPEEIDRMATNPELWRRR